LDWWAVISSAEVLGRCSGGSPGSGELSRKHRFVGQQTINTLTIRNFIIVLSAAPSPLAIMTNWFSIGALLIVFVFTLVLVLFYASKRTPYYVYMSVFIGWFLAFSIIAILPYDVYLAIQPSSPTTDDARRSLWLVWEVLYWTVQILCWCVLPVIQEYEMGGEFRFGPRLRWAVFRHVRVFIAAGAVGVALVIYLSIETDLSISQLPAILVALSNTWGLFLTMVLLGYGLVTVPRELWADGDLAKELGYLQYKATVLHEEVNEAQFQLNEVVKVANAAQYRNSTDKDTTHCVAIIIEKCPMDLLEHHKAMGTHNSRDAAETLGDMRESRLIALHTELKTALNDYHRSQCQWDRLKEAAFALEDILNCKYSPEKRIFSPLWTRSGCSSRAGEVLEWAWLTRVKPCLSRLLAIVCVVCSGLVVLGEATLFLDKPIGLVPLLFRFDLGNFQTQLLCAIPLLYILFCADYALFKLKLAGFYGLYGHNQTDPSNLAWNAYFLARISAPLCYNFLLFIKVRGTMFCAVMGVIDLVPVLGESFTHFFPLALVGLCAMNLFNLYSKLMSLVGLSQFKFVNIFDPDKVSEGANLLAAGKR